MRSAAREQAVAEAEREVGAAWTNELLRLRDATRLDMDAIQELLDVIAEELDLVAQAAERRARAVRVGRLRVACARNALYPPSRP